MERIATATSRIKPGTRIAEQYRNQLKKSVPPVPGTESTPQAEAKPDLSAAGIAQKTESVRESLYRIIENYLDQKAELYAIADKMTSTGADALKAVADDNNRFLERNPTSRNYLEVIVRTDGSRPSFMIRNGKVDFATSPVGIWEAIIRPSENQINDAIACVGRINVNGAHVGTGFLVQKNFILTNRHVLQAIATRENDGSWMMDPKATVDFGYEFRASNSINPRRLKRVVFCGAKYIERYTIDHNKLDLALIELEPGAIANPKILPLYIAPEWVVKGKVLFTIGYPGDPGLEGLVTYSTLLELLFKSTFGYKRLAPGEVMDHTPDSGSWTVTHDTTTLGGNSGSLILAQAKEFAAAGIHYGGTVAAPRENWGHALALTLDATDGRSSKTFREHLNACGVQLIDL